MPAFIKSLLCADIILGIVCPLSYFESSQQPWKIIKSHFLGEETKPGRSYLPRSHPARKWWGWFLLLAENTGSVPRPLPCLILNTLCPQGTAGEPLAPSLPLPVSCGTGETDGTSHPPKRLLGLILVGWDSNTESRLRNWLLTLDFLSGPCGRHSLLKCEEKWKEGSKCEKGFIMWSETADTVFCKRISF